MTVGQPAPGTRVPAPAADQAAPFDPGRGWLLDGALGTELGRRGVDIGLPLWSANALLGDAGLATLRQLHADYLAAGARILTANTFRCHRRSLAKAGLGERAPELVARAVAAARQAMAEDAAARGATVTAGAGTERSAEPRGTARSHRPADRLLAGSLAPLEDCYRPDLVPDEAALAAEHAELARHLADAGCDLILVETMNTVREAVAAARAGVATGLPTLVCFVCGPDGRLLSGESLADAAAAVVPLGIAAVGVNCTAAHLVARCLARLPAGVPRVAYANIGYAAPDGGWVVTDAVDPPTYARVAARWDAQIIGGCCGTTPEHVRAVATIRPARPN